MKQLCDINLGRPASSSKGGQKSREARAIRTESENLDRKLDRLLGRAEDLSGYHDCIVAARAGAAKP